MKWMHIYCNSENGSTKWFCCIDGLYPIKRARPDTSFHSVIGLLIRVAASVWFGPFYKYVWKAVLHGPPCFTETLITAAFGKKKICHKRQRERLKWPVRDDRGYRTSRGGGGRCAAKSCYMTHATFAHCSEIFVERLFLMSRRFRFLSEGNNVL